MTKRMLIDGVHPEQTRVVVMDNQRLLEFDTEIASQRTLKGNIYLAKVTRVEPSLQAAFVDYGGNRHGFLPFSEIHPDYYRIPVADREALKESQRRHRSRDDDPDPDDDDDELDTDDEFTGAGAADDDEDEPEGGRAQALDAADSDPSVSDDNGDDGDNGDGASGQEGQGRPRQRRGRRSGRNSEGRDRNDDRRSGNRPPRRTYTIQEVIKRGQIMLVQVVKEERGTKGAAVTTYLSLAGRYCVLMPNTARGGGISRKITNGKDRKRLKDIVDSLDIQDSMAVIVRTAGIGRTKSEIKRDYDFLAKTWERIRDTTLQSRAPVLIYEESGLIKRTLRDSYTREIDEVIVQGDMAYREAKDFMRTLMPSHAKRVQPYKDVSPPLFHRFNVDSQLHDLHSPIVQLPSGGYLVINMTEALVAIDINSGRSTRERHIEETAIKTNLEAADEIARQLRLRDLAGLIVIDFIDMDDRRNNYAVERRLKEAMRPDRARVQIGRISQLGLLELSRQRLRPSLLETIMDICPVCDGLGRVASTSASALQVLSAIENEGMRGRSSVIRVHVAAAVAFYVLNEKRDDLVRIERDYGLRCIFEPDAKLIPPNLKIEVLADADQVIDRTPEPEQIEAAAPPLAELEEESAQPSRRRGRRSAEEQEETGEREEGGRRRRGRRSGRRRDEAEAPETPAEPHAADAAEGEADDSDASSRDRSNRRRRRRRRGRGEGRSGLPGVAVFARSATPLAWHVAAIEADDDQPSANGYDRSAEAITAATPEQDRDGQDAGPPPHAETEEAAPVAAFFAGEDAAEPAGTAEAASAEASQGEREADTSVSAMLMPVAQAMEKAPRGRRARRRSEPSREAAPEPAETPAPEAGETPETAPEPPPELVAEGAGPAAGEPLEAPAEPAANEADPAEPETSSAMNGSGDEAEEIAEAPIMVSEAQVEVEAEATEEAEAAAAARPKRPRRRGWWQRLLE